MANTARTQMALAHSLHFQSRVKAALAKVAWQVLNENPSVSKHTERANFARTVIAQLDNVTNGIVGWLVERPGVFTFNTSYDFEVGTVITASGDSDIESQLTSDWNIMGGI